MDAGQLVQAVDALHRAGQAEGARHRQAEAAMQEAVALFKAELAEKSSRLAALQADLKCCPVHLKAICLHHGILAFARLAPHLGSTMHGQLHAVLTALLSHDWHMLLQVLWEASCHIPDHKVSRSQPGLWQCPSEKKGLCGMKLTLRGCIFWQSHADAKMATLRLLQRPKE